MSDIEIVPLASVEAFGVTVQLTVCWAAAGTLLGPKLADLLHPAGTVSVAVTFVQFPLPVPVNLSCTLKGWETFIVLSTAPAGEEMTKLSILSWRFASVNVFCACNPDWVPAAVR